MDNQNEIKTIPQKKSKKLLIAGGIIALLAVVGGGIVYTGVQGGWFKGAFQFEITEPLVQQDMQLVIPTYYVDRNTSAALGVDDYNTLHANGTKTQPYTLIAPAIAKIKADQKTSAKLYIAKGTYNEGINLAGFTSFQVLGGYDSTFTTQNTTTNQTIVNGLISGANLTGVVSGITFKNFENNNIFININNSSSAKTFEVSNNYFENANTDNAFIQITSATGGKGIIKGNKFVASVATVAGINSVVGGETIIEKNIFYATKANNALIKGEKGTTVKNNLISRPAVGNGADIIGNEINILNNTIYLDENSSTCIIAAQNSKVYNNLVYRCSGLAIAKTTQDVATNNAVWPENTNTGYLDMTKNYICDPKFVGPTYTSNPESFKLANDSTCLNKGFTSTLVTDDYFGTTRPQETSTEIGFYEKPFTVIIPDGGLDGGTLPPLDACSNITGNQTVVPSGYTKEGTLCIKCGDNLKEGSEVCDDGNTTSGDGCSASCTIEDLCTNLTGIQSSVPNGYTKEGNICIKCGDGTREGSEVCDDGNNVSSDGCNAACTILETDVCTNLQGFQLQVPTGYVVSSGTTCVQATQSAVCGNNSVEAGEQCDDGNTSNLDACTNNCKTAICGDGYKRTGIEECDDGDTNSGDGCSSSCRTETSVTSVCGNNIKESGEECDDGNNSSGDGCSASCHDEETTVVTEEPVCDWPDVSETDPEYGIWVWECQRGILRGYDNGNLGIDNKLTRAELLAIAFRARDYENLGEVDFDSENCFNDGRGEWYEPYACTGKDEGFIQGYSGNVFKGGNNVILAEGLKMFLGALDMPYTTSSDPWFYDMVWNAHLNEGLPYSLRDQNDIIPVGTIELTRRRAINMLYRLQIM